MIKKETTNWFEEGLQMDNHPLVMSDKKLTNCLNGTLVTFNGNEGLLQNDMGNCKVETAKLPEGYIPLGTCSHGGFIYVVSYNPLKDLCQIGSFPSPERNIDTTELDDKIIKLVEDDFYLSQENIIPNNEITDNIVGFEEGDNYRPLKAIFRKVFDKVTLYPGDKFIVFSENLFSENLSDYGNDNHELNNTIRQWKIRLGSLEDSGKINEFNNLKWYKDDIGKGDYFIKSLAKLPDLPKYNYDQNQSIVSSAYSVYQPKKSGKLLLSFLPEAPDTYGVSFNAYKSKNDWQYKGGISIIDPNDIIYIKDPKSVTYDIFINSSWTSEHKNVNPEGIIVKMTRIDNPSNIEEQSDKKEVNKGIFHVNNMPYGKSFLFKVPFNIDNEENNQIEDILKKNKSEYYKNKYIHRIYEDGYPALEGENSLYYVGLTDSPTDKDKKQSVPDNYLVNKFEIDAPHKLYSFAVPKDIKDGEFQYKLEIYPYIKTGYLPHLKKELIIDFSKIGKQNIQLTEWNYYIDSVYNGTLNWALEAYTFPNQQISKVWLEFYDNQGLCATHILDNLASYNSKFQTKFNLETDSMYFRISPYKEGNKDELIKHKGTLIVNLDDVDDENVLIKDEDGNTYVNDAGIIHAGVPYLVKIKYRLTNLGTFSDDISEPIDVTRRWLWTIPIFNESFTNGVVDFVDLNPELKLDVNVQYSPNENYAEYKGLYSNAANIEVIDESTEKKDNAHQLSSNMQYIRDLNKEKGNITSRATLLFQNDYNTFGVSDSSGFILNVGLGEAHITKSTESPNIISDDSSNINEKLLIPEDLIVENVKLSDAQKKIFNIELGESKEILDYWDPKEGLEESNIFWRDIPYNITNNKAIILGDYFKLKKKVGSSWSIKITLAESNPIGINWGEGLKLSSSNTEHIFLIESEHYNNVILNGITITGHDSNLPEIVSIKFREVISINPEDTSTWTCINNQYHLSLVKDDWNNSSLENIDTVDTINNDVKTWDKLDTISKEFSDGYLDLGLDLEAIYHSRFYNTSKDAQTKFVHLLKSVIENKTDLSKYNLVLNDGNLYFNKGLNIFIFDKGHGKDTNYGMSSYTLNKDGQNFNMNIDQKQVHKHNGDTVRRSLSEIINEAPQVQENIEESINLFFPVTTLSQEKGSGNGFIMKDGKCRQWYRNTSGFDKIPLSGLGGFLGGISDGSMFADFFHPVISHYDNDPAHNTSHKKWAGTSVTFYAKLVFSLLRQLYYKADTTEEVKMYIYDLYTYLESLQNQFTNDIIYNVSYSKDINDVLVLGKIMLYKDYINQTFNNSNVSKGKLDNNITCVLQNCTKTAPLTFNFNYIQPETFSYDLSNICLYKNQIIEGLQDELYTVSEMGDNETKKYVISPYNGLSEFKIYNNFENTYIDDGIDGYGRALGNMTLKPLTKFRTPVLWEYLEFKNNLLSISKSYVASEQQLNSQYEISTGNEGDGGGNILRITGITGYNIFQLEMDDEFKDCDITTIVP